MKDDNPKQVRAHRVLLTEDACDLEAFRPIVEHTVILADYPYASEVASNVLIYDSATVRSAIAAPETRKEIMAEWVETLSDGPGIMVLRGAFADPAPIDASNAHYWAMIEDDRRSNIG